jgi:GTPase
VAQKMLRATAQAVEKADVVAFVVDARAGLTPEDERFAAWLRAARRGDGRRVIVLANKAERLLTSGAVLSPEDWEAGAGAEFLKLGLGPPVPVSAEHGDGLMSLHDEIVQILQDGEDGEEDGEEDGDGEGEEDGEMVKRVDDGNQNGGDQKVLRLAIVGRPNVGKSSTLNALCGSTRALTGPTPGLTRDPVEVEWTTEDGVKVQLVDTAGLHRWGVWNLDSQLDVMARLETRKALERAQVVALVVDGSVGVTRVDLSIASKVVESGRALVVVVNKLDAVPNAAEVVEKVRKSALAHVGGGGDVPVVALSALRNTGVSEIVPNALRAREAWWRRVPTSRLNKWFEHLCRVHPPPTALKAAVRKPTPQRNAARSLPLRVKFIAQTDTAPPHFTVFANRSQLPEPYARFLVGALRDEFALHGAPVRLSVRAPDNPFKRRPTPADAVRKRRFRPASPTAPPTAAGTDRRREPKKADRRGGGEDEVRAAYEAALREQRAERLREMQHRARGRAE